VKNPFSHFLGVCLGALGVLGGCIWHLPSGGWQSKLQFDSLGVIAGWQSENKPLDLIRVMPA
jgi:hypothetical protein